MRKRRIAVCFVCLAASAAACSLANQASEPTAPPPLCTAPVTECSGVCVDLASDAANCGACGDACGQNEACTAGACACVAGTRDCNGSCVDTKTDVANCAACGHACPTNSNATATCVASLCVSTCAQGFDNCDTTADDCETNVTTDVNHCGSCPNACAPVAQGTPGCAASECVVASCQNGFDDCDAVFATGCEAVLASDRNHCGDCLTTCGANESCVDGQCTAVCEWDAASLPLPIAVHASNYFGEIAFDGNCDLLVTGAFDPNNPLYRVSRTTGTVSTVATAIGNSGNMTGVVFRHADNTIYVANDGIPELWRVVNGQPSLVAATPTGFNALAEAPPGFGAYSGLLFGAGIDKKIYVIDPTVPSFTLFASASAEVSDLAFMPDGSSLYAVVYTSSELLRIDAAGGVATFFAGLSSPDGIAVSPDGTRMAVAHYSGGSRIDSIDIANAVLTPGPSVNLDGGYYTTGLLIDASNDVVLLTDTGVTMFPLP